VADGKVEIEFTAINNPEHVTNLIRQGVKRAMYYAQGYPPEDFGYKIMLNGEVVDEYPG
jgi:hypothetical protein